MGKWEDVGYILASETRVRILEVLNGRQATPSSLAKKLGRSRSTVSTVLRGLVDQGFVECLNPEQRKGRVYGLSGKGKRTYEDVLRVVSERGT